MSPSNPKKKPESDPFHDHGADWRALMDGIEETRFPIALDPDDPAVDEVLSHWDELSPAGIAWVEAHPTLAPRLERLRLADEWLAGGSCPDAEELYAYGRGPGYAPLDEERRAHIDDHLATCGTCSSLVTTLASAPPLPLELAGDPDLEHAPTSAPARARRPQRVLPFWTTSRWLTAAAAAALVATAAWRWNGAPVQGAGPLPLSPTLRGEGAGPLLFPRDRVLAEAPPGLSGPVFASSPLFEIEHQPGANHYRIVLRKHGGGAFDQGEVVARFEGPSPLLHTDLALSRGNYTWEAWVTVDGLEHSLGARDFEVVPGSELGGSALEGWQALERLHAAGFSSDARAFARSLPPSPERDRYLEALPGR